MNLLTSVDMKKKTQDLSECIRIRRDEGVDPPNLKLWNPPSTFSTSQTINLFEKGLT